MSHVSTDGAGDLPGTARRRIVARASRVAAVGAGLLIVLATHGFLPGMSQVPLTAFEATGTIQCLHDQGIESLWTWCMSVGLPVGQPHLTGMPQMLAGWVLSYLPGIDAWASHQLVSAALDGVAFIGFYLLLRRWGAAWGFAVLSVTAFMVAPNLLILNGFRFTFLGYLLLPAATYALLRSLDWFRGGRPWRAMTVAVLVSLFMVFTDGYVFFGFALPAGGLIVHWLLSLWGRVPRRALATGAVAWAAALVIAPLSYAAYTPEDAYESNVPLEFFARLGVDVATLFVRSDKFFASSLLPSDAGWLWRLWGAQSTPPTNYLGYAALALCCGVLVRYVLLRRRAVRGGAGDAPEQAPDAHVGEFVALLVVGVIATMLSLGPTVKLGQVAEGMDASLLRLPTAWLYENIPGLSEMRAVNRWAIVTRFALLAGAAVGLSQLWRSARRRGAMAATAVVALAVLTYAETAPGVSSIINQRRASIAHVHTLRDGYAAEFDELVEKGETVLMLPTVNDFVAEYVVPLAGAKSYNVGPDKNYFLAKRHWPADVLEASLAPLSEDYSPLCEVLDGEADAVVLSYINLRNGALLGGIGTADDLEREVWARQVAASPLFDASVGEWMVVLRPADGAGCGA